MKKILKTTCFIIIIAIISISAVSFIKINNNKDDLTKKIEYYLFNQKKYTKLDIKQIKVSYHLDRLIFGYTPYVISVVVSDEPETIYYYSVHNGSIYQSAMGGKSIGVKHEGK